MSSFNPGTKRKLASTLNYHGPYFWENSVRVLPLPYIPPDRTHRLIEEFQWVFRVVKAAYSADVLLLNCASGKIYPDLLASIVIGFWPKALRPLVILIGPLYEPNNGFRHIVENAVLKLADRSILRYVVWASEALEEVPRTWAISRNKMRRCNYFFTFTKADLDAHTDQSGYIFSGGNSHRDYEPLIEAARLMPDQRFVIATRLLQHRTDLPSNVTAIPTSHMEFVALMKASQAVVIPMRQGMHRSAGEQTILNAMFLEKLVIANRFFGVDDVIHDTETGLIVSGEPESYVEAIRWSLNPDNQGSVSRICSTAHTNVIAHFKYEDHLAKLLEIVEEAVFDPAVQAQCRIGRHIPSVL